MSAFAQVKIIDPRRCADCVENEELCCPQCLNNANSDWWTKMTEEERLKKFFGED